MRKGVVLLAALGSSVLWPAEPGGTGPGTRTSGDSRVAGDRAEVAAGGYDPVPTAPVSPGHGPRTPFHPSGSPRELLLTFDDGPELRLTPLVMEELDRRGLKGIFFISGWRLVGDRAEALARRDLVRKLASHGHLVANHTMTHRNLCQNPRLAADEIDRNNELIAAATGVRPLLFRSPYGAWCRSLEAALAARELADVGWNIDPQDWKLEVGEDEAFAYLVGKLEALQGRGIMLLHDTQPAAVHALPRVLDWIERENRRAEATGRAGIRILDYTGLLPPRAVPETGFGRLLASVAGSFDALAALR